MEIFTNVKSLLAISGVFPSVSKFESDKPSRLTRLLKIFVFLTIFFGFYSLTLVYSIKYLEMMEAMQAAGYINNGVLCVGTGYATLIFNRNVLWKTIGGWEQVIMRSKINKSLI